MEARAIKKYIGSSPRKMRLVTDLIRGKSVEAAINILHFTPKHATKVVELTLRSALSNLMAVHDQKRVDPNEVYVKKITVDGGPMQKRVLPAPMGRAFRVRKRSNHLTIVVAEKE